MIKQALKIFKGLNTVFISLALLIFYFIVIGLTAVIYKVVTRKSREKSSYWINADKLIFGFDDFKSSY